MNGHPLSYSTEENDLGIIIDCNVNLSKHISAKIIKANSVV